MTGSPRSLFNIPQHRPHKPHNAQQACFNPNLKIEIMRVNERSIRMIQIVVPNICLCSSGTKARARNW